MKSEQNSANFDCPAAQALDQIGDWRSILIIRDVGQGLHKFEELRRSLGMATNILSSRLKHLTASGLLEQRLYSSHPPRFEYAVTEKGKDFFPVIVALYGWAQRNLAGDEIAVWLGDRETGSVLEPVVVNAKTGLPITAENFILLPGQAATSSSYARIEKVRHLSPIN